MPQYPTAATRAILTGHSRGLGAAMATTLLARGIPVLALARRRHAPDQPAAPAGLQAISLDLGDSAELARWLADGALAHFLAGASQALLINNAGTLQPMGLAGTLPPAAIARAMALNVSAPLMLCEAFLTATVNLPDRRILHVSSGAARSAYPGWSVYCASKAALDHHARSVALEAHPGLRIASVAPGVVDTAMQGEIRGSNPDNFPLHDRFVALKRDGQLTPPAVAGQQLVDLLLDDGFGTPVIADLRDDHKAAGATAKHKGH